MSQLAPDRRCAAISLGVHRKRPPLFSDGAGQGAVDGFSTQSASRYRGTGDHTCVQGPRKRSNQSWGAGLCSREVLLTLSRLLFVLPATATGLTIVASTDRLPAGVAAQLTEHEAPAHVIVVTKASPHVNAIPKPNHVTRSALYALERELT